MFLFSYLIINDLNANNQHKTDYRLFLTITILFLDDFEVMLVLRVPDMVVLHIFLHLLEYKHFSRQQMILYK